MGTDVTNVIIVLFLLLTAMGVGGFLALNFVEEIRAFLVKLLRLEEVEK